MLPLHIFEDRYKEMMGNAIRDRSEFGIVQAREQGIVNMGCTATVERVLRQYPDGRMDLLAIGRRRFEIIALDDEKQYLRGSVEFFDDEDCELAPREVREKAIDSFVKLGAIEEAHVAGEPKLDDPQLSFQLAQLVSDLDIKQMLLASRSEAERIRKLAEFLPDYVNKQRRIAHVKAVAPRNGHAARPADL